MFYLFLFYLFSLSFHSCNANDEIFEYGRFIKYSHQFIKGKYEKIAAKQQQKHMI